MATVSSAHPDSRPDPSAHTSQGTCHKAPGSLYEQWACSCRCSFWSHSMFYL